MTKSVQVQFLRKNPQCSRRYAKSLAGFMTHACINSTARGAFNLGYHATIVAPATATRDLPGLGGEIVPAEHVQAASLAAAGDIFAVIVTKLEAID